MKITFPFAMCARDQAQDPSYAGKSCNYYSALKITFLKKLGSVIKIAQVLIETYFYIQILNGALKNQFYYLNCNLCGVFKIRMLTHFFNLEAVSEIAFSCFVCCSPRFNPFTLASQASQTMAIKEKEREVAFLSLFIK